MTKLQELKQALKNPPPERLARIEYRNHFYLIGAYTFAGVFLFRAGFWFIIPIFIFSSLISYSAGMSALMKYRIIKQFVPEIKPKDYEKDISITRRRSNIVKYIYGDKIGWGIAIASVLMALFIIDPTQSRWVLMILYPGLIGAIYFGMYFGIAYWMAYPIYKIRMKGGVKDAK